MANRISMPELVAELVSLASAHGVAVTSTSERALTGHQETIKSKWLLGGRKVTYRMSCELDDASQTVRFREAATESSWGVPPPTLTVEKTIQHGTRVDESRSDRGVGGGGRLDYGSLRADVEKAVHADGWQFTLDAGRMP